VTRTAAGTCAPTPPTGSDPPPRVRLSGRPRDGRLCILAAGWTADELERLRAEGPGRLLAVLPSELVAASRGLAGLARSAGRFDLAGQEVWFAPRHPLRDGLRYSLLWTADGEAVELGSVELPAAPGEPVTSVREIRPTCPEIPHNCLRLYIAFSGPMGEGWAADAVRVVDEASGETLHGALLPMEPELWDPARRRLTVLFDPGRIKRGLRPHEELGYPLRPGRALTVVVDGGFRDAAGRRLVASATRRYRVGPAERRRVDPGLWSWTWPSGPGEPLEVAFDRPLDHALLHRCIRVLEPDGADLPVAVSVAEGEGGAALRPADGWRRGGRYRVAIDPRLEDLAGNSLRRVFDRDLVRPEDAPSGLQDRTLDFVCDW
jgi:hypothetical protein